MASSLFRNTVAHWAWLWLPPLSLLGVASLAFGRAAEALTLTEQFLLGFALSTVFGYLSLTPFVRSQSGKILLMFLALLVVSGFVERRLSVSVWQNPAGTGLVSTLKALREDKITASGVRAWAVPADQKALTLSFEARLLAGQVGWDWIRSVPDFQVRPLQEQGEIVTRVETPSGPDPYLMRTFDLQEPVGGRTFKVELELRAPQPVPAEGCRGVWLQVWSEGGAAQCLAVALDRNWKPFELVWTAPEAARSTVIRVVLNDFDGLSYDVRRVKLYSKRGEIWQRLEPLIPQGAYVQFGWPNKPPEAYSGTAFLPTRAWKPYTFYLQNSPDTLQKTALRESPLTAVLHMGSSEDGSAVLETRNTVLHSQTGELSPTPVKARQSFFFEHPNLAGHTLVTLCLVLLSLTSTSWVSILAVGLATSGIWLTGSRAAWLAALVSFPWLLWLGQRSRQRFWLLAGMVAASALLLSSGGLANLGRLQFIGVSDAVSRPKIWRAAWHAFSDHPWTGIGADGFPTYWSAYAKTNFPIPHAHNLWLQFAALYGLPGLIAILWLTGGLLYLAWTWGRWRGLALVVPIFIMNVFDYTLFYSGVLFPLILGLNALRQAKEAVPDEPWTRPRKRDKVSEG